MVHLIEFLRADHWDVTLVSRGHGRDVDRHRIHQLGVPTFPESELPSLLEGNEFQLALIVFWKTAERHLPTIRSLSPQTKVAVDSIDLHFVRRAREVLSDTAREKVLDEEFGADFARELNAYAMADAVLTVSEKEAALLEDITDGRVQGFPVPLCEDPTIFEYPDGDRRGILFLANFQHPPNRDALHFLCEEIVPLIPADVLERHPVSVVGNALSDELIEKCRNGGITPVGWVPSVVPYFARARVAIAPLRYGAGTKNKMIQAFMAGTPTVATTMATEGLDLEDGKWVRITDEPRAFAAAVAELAVDDDAWSALVGSPRELMVDAHDRSTVEVLFRGVVASIASPSPPPRADRRAHTPKRNARLAPGSPNGHRSHPSPVRGAGAYSRPRAPIFVVGSPRSGTSILTWSLGQHPNILPMEESNWLAKLAINLATAHALGSARGERSQLSAMGIEEDAFLATFGATAFDMLLENKRRYAELLSGKGAATSQGSFQVIRSPDDPKARWVDGTPEYSHHIVALHQMFPDAKFIHLLRDVRSTTVSMVNFYKVGGPRWDWNQAYDKWLKHVRACVAAEHAFGSGVVMRLRHRDLVEDAEGAIDRCLAFVGEPFDPACLEPLREDKINSSGVDDREAAMEDLEVDANLEREAVELSDSLLAEPPGEIPMDPDRVEELVSAYRARMTAFERMYAKQSGAIARRTLAVDAELSEGSA